MIRGIEDREEFERILNENLSPSQPIRTVERLKGRDSELSGIDRALAVAGRHVFIYGDRGVGKSSLASSAAAQVQSADAEPIQASCARADFQSVVVDIAHQALSQSRIKESVRQNHAELDLRLVKLGCSTEETYKNLRSCVTCFQDAVGVLREVALCTSREPVVVIDEFDRMPSMDERSLFADLVKQIGDQGIGIRFIFTGVGGALDELLGAHESAIRQLHTIELDRLSWEGRIEIVVEAFNAFNLEIPEEWRWKIAIMSDGFPFYVHLICEQILWHVFEISEAVSKIADRHYKLGLQQAIACISAELKRPYDVATQSDPKLFEPILWGTASSERLDNDIGDMYHGYQHVIDQLDDVALLDRGKFGDRLRRLVKKSHGQILISEKRRGWYKYRESMLRGYVRMQADANGIDLIDRLARTSEKKHLKVAARSTGYRGPMVPAGVRFAREEKKRQR